MLAKKTPFTPAEEAAVTNISTHYPKIEPLYTAVRTRSRIHSPSDRQQRSLRFRAQLRLQRRARDRQRAFFFFTLKPGQILGEKGLRGGIDWKVNLGVLVLLLVLAISLVAVLVFLVLPLA